jgi:glycosyltransferase involved in cell wall biosynthesis
VTNSFKDVLIKRGIEEHKIDVITNGVDLSRFKPIEKDNELVNKYDLKGKFVAGYIGTHGMAHALETLLYAAEKLIESQDSLDIRIILLGDGASKSKLQQYARDKELNNVIFIDSVSKDEVARYWSILDVSIIHLKNTDLFKTVIPSKLFESMGMGIPILMGVQGESAEIINYNHVGVCFEPENADNLVASLEKLYKNNNLYDSCSNACLITAESYDRKFLANKMLEIIARTVES